MNAFRCSFFKNVQKILYIFKFVIEKRKWP